MVSSTSQLVLGYIKFMTVTVFKKTVTIMNFIVIVIIKIYQPLCFLTCEQRLLSCLVGLWDRAKRSRESAKRWKGMGMGRSLTSLHFSSNHVSSGSCSQPLCFSDG